MRHTSDVSNIAIYKDGGVVVEVLEQTRVRRGDRWVRPARPVYTGHVRRQGVGLVAEFSYRPTRSRSGPLLAATVARLTCEALS